MRWFGAGGRAGTLLGHCQASHPGGMQEQLAPNQRPTAGGWHWGDNPLLRVHVWPSRGASARWGHPHLPQESLHVGTCTHTQGMGCVIHAAREGALKCWGYKSMLRNLQAFINILLVSSTVVYLMCCWFQS